MAEVDYAKTKPMKEESEATPLTPWEQHASVISIPRFDYAAPFSLLQRSHSGFLVTCTISMREKRVLQKVMSILGKYLGSFTESVQDPEISDISTATKRRKLFMDEEDGEPEMGIKSEGSIAEYVVGNMGSNNLKVSKPNVENNWGLSLVKLTRSGLLLLTFPKDNPPDTTEIVSNIFQSLESGGLKLPAWCHRIFPIQATCNLKEREMRETILKLVQQFVNHKHAKISKPLKFAAAYNRRGMEETQMTNPTGPSKDFDKHALLDRTKCFEVVAAAVKDVVSDSVVDLKFPELCVLVELLPLSGVPYGSLVAAVSVLPQGLVSTKPRLCIKPLSDTNPKSGKS